MNNDLSFIKDFLSNLLERDLYYPIEQLFTHYGYNVKNTHGGYERGRDFIATKPNEHNLLISVKKGHIDKDKWSGEVLSSIDQMIKRPINYAGIDENLEKRILLVLNGYLKGEMPEIINEYQIYHAKHSEPNICVWDLSTLAEKLYQSYESIPFFSKEYQEELNCITSLISEGYYNKERLQQFVHNNFSFTEKRFFAFRLVFNYVARYSEKKSNPYAFFFFAENALVKAWEIMYSKKEYQYLSMFDQLHMIYVEELEKWVCNLDLSDNGVFDSSSRYFAELLSYPLRTFDVIRRISYLIYFSMISRYNFEKVDSYLNKLIIIIQNNRGAAIPLCEFNCNDIGLASLVLLKRKRWEILNDWIFEMLEFLTSHFSQGYRTVSLKDPLSKVTDFLVPKECKGYDTNNDEVYSNLLLVLIEFIIRLGSRETFNTYKRHLSLKVGGFELVGPSNEHFIYDLNFIHGETIQFDIPSDFSLLEGEFSRLVRMNPQPCYSPLRYGRPWVLVLISNVFKDRYFPQIWRNVR